MDFARQLMPAPIFNQVIRLAGIRMAWMKSHVCPCTMSTDQPGSPNSSCNTCHGRGRWWEDPIGPFTLLRTFMHSTEASDEPGVVMDPQFGQQLHAEPTITIPADVQPLWDEASEFDAYMELDTLQRFETTLLVGENTVLPYQQNLVVQTVTRYDSDAQRIQLLTAGQWNNDRGKITLYGFPDGTAFSVMYKANPIYIAWRRAGGNVHARPFGAGTDALPKRFRAMLLDEWTRSRNQFGDSASPQALG